MDTASIARRRAYSYASKIAQACHISKEETEIISLAGRVEQPRQVGSARRDLKKEGPLTSEEMDVVRKSPSVAPIARASPKLLYRVSQIIESYHENCDGTGYPKGPQRQHHSSWRAHHLDSRCIYGHDQRSPLSQALNKDEALKALQEGRRHKSLIRAWSRSSSLYYRKTKRTVDVLGSVSLGEFAMRFSRRDID